MKIFKRRRVKSHSTLESHYNSQVGEPSLCRFYNQICAINIKQSDEVAVYIVHDFLSIKIHVEDKEITQSVTWKLLPSTNFRTLKAKVSRSIYLVACSSIS